MVNERRASISPAQLRAARVWLSWTQDELSERTGVSKRSIARYELGRTAAYDSTLETLRSAFEQEGIRFLFKGARGVGIEVD
jgi:transcriptional regulator with XRE-family HTH domain